MMHEMFVELTEDELAELRGGTELAQIFAKRANLDKRPEVKPIDLVNHPPHYTQHPSGIECIQITEHMGFNLGNAVKYIWRADLKGSSIQDLEKARWYLDREIAKRKGK